LGKTGHRPELHESLIRKRGNAPSVPGFTPISSSWRRLEFKHAADKGFTRIWPYANLRLRFYILVDLPESVMLIAFIPIEWMIL
jgi:hypothetical protein